MRYCSSRYAGWWDVTIKHGPWCNICRATVALRSNSCIDRRRDARYYGSDRRSCVIYPLVPDFGIFVNLWNRIKAFSPVFPDFLRDYGPRLPDFFSRIPAFFGGLGNSIKGFFTGIGNSITGFFTGIWTSITGFFTRLGTSISLALKMRGKPLCHFLRSQFRRLSRRLVSGSSSSRITSGLLSGLPSGRLSISAQAYGTG